MEATPSNKPPQSPKQLHWYLQQSLLKPSPSPNPTLFQKIFWILDIHLTKDGPLSLESQKLINYYIQKKCQILDLGAFVTECKELICKVYDFGIVAANGGNGNGGFEAAVRSGAICEAVWKKLEKECNGDLEVYRLVSLCVLAVAVNFCIPLKTLTQKSGSKIKPTNLPPKHIPKKYLHFPSSQTFLQQIFSNPVTVLSGFLDNLKPMIGNYLNMESLFQVTASRFRNKRGFFCGWVGIGGNGNGTAGNGGRDFVGRIVQLNTVFDSSYTGREMIQTRLAQLSLNQSQNKQQSKNSKWSLLTCLSQLQPHLQTIVQKLPLFLRPKSNSDILSYCQSELTPTFKYQVTKPGYTQKPLLSEFVTVFMNVGKLPFQVIAFWNQEGRGIAEKLTEMGDLEKIGEILGEAGLWFSRVLVGSRSVAAVPSNCYYVILSQSNESNKDSFVQIIHWNVFPKHHESLKQTLSSTATLKSFHNPSIPLQHILLSYLNHEYLQINNPETIALIKNYIQAQLNKEQTHLCNMLTKKDNFTVVASREIGVGGLAGLGSCPQCRCNFVNFCCKGQAGLLCMECGAKDIARIQTIGVLYEPNDFRYPLTLAGIYIAKRKFPTANIPNRYQKNICTGKFIGSIQAQNCKPQSQPHPHSSHSHHHHQSPEQVYLHITQKHLKITSIQQQLISIALCQPQTQEQKAQLLEKVKTYVKEIEDPESIIKEICHKYRKDNLVTEVMWEVRVAGADRVFPPK